MMKLASRFFCVGIVLWACLFPTGAAAADVWAPAEIENVILMILDGVGPYQYELTRLVYGELNIDRMLAVGSITTHSADADITESPAAATALATGQKTNNVMVAIAPDGTRLKTVLEYAKEVGMATGLITTVMIYDATPAAFAAHNESRYNQADIASEMLEQGVDVLLGGGRTLFDDEGLVPRTTQLGYTYVETGPELSTVIGERVLGLFAGADMSYELDRHLTNEPSISEMTEKAIEILSAGDEGFFLMVEGGKTDWAGHRNDAASIAGDLKAFDDAVGVAMEFADNNGQTLIIIASDHETGGLSYSSSDGGFIAGFLQQVTAGVDYIGTRFNKDRSNVESVIRQYTPIQNLTTSEIRRIQDCGEGYQSGRMEPGNTIGAVLSGYERVNFSTTYHTAADVPLLWYGAGAFEYSGLCDNTDIGKQLISIVTRQGVWSDSAILWEDAADHVGTIASVYGEVVQTGGAGTTYINLGNPFPSFDMFFISIPPESRALFEARFGEAPHDFFDNTNLVAYGEIEVDAEGRPYILLRDPFSIRVLPD